MDDEDIDDKDLFVLISLTMSDFKDKSWNIEPKTG